MKVIDLFKPEKPVISFEIFPPRMDTPIETIFDKLEQFSAMKPDFMSVTYGAGGSQRGRTVEIASKIKNEYRIECVAHFTCVGHSEEEIDSMLELMEENKLKNVLALRGDPPINQPDFDFSKNVYKNATELVRHIKSKNDFCIAAAAYLEGHPENKTLREDRQYLRQKVDAGVDYLMTQFFFDNRLYYDFVEKVNSEGVNCPVVPGIMPIFKADQIKTMTAKSGCSLPAKLVLMMDKYSDNPDDLMKAGIEYASIQIRDLVDNGAPGVHLYTMNRPTPTKEIMAQAGLL